MAVNVVPTVIYSSMLGVTLFALLECLSKPRQRQTAYLIALISLLLVHILGELHIYSGFYQYAPSLAGLQFPIRMLLGPALYFYAFATMSPDKALPRKAYALAMLGPVLIILIMLPFLFGSSPEEKLALADPSTRDPALWKIAVTTCVVSMLAFILFTGAYLVATLRLHARHRRQLLDRFASIEDRSMDWFRVVLLLWGAAWLLFAIEYIVGFLGYRWFGSGIVLPTIEAVILLVFAHLAINQPVLTDSDKGKETDKDKESAAPSRLPSLKAERMEQIAQTLNQVMAKDKLYMESDLSLKKLSETISVSENHISETLSQFLDTNFFQFVNEYRVDAAKQLVKGSDMQVSAIAYEVGFNSKSTFNAAFKKSVGETPTAYRRQQIH
ncbi:helix-turn-helix domain-containing protein [Microbulbifer agarilyticus]|uniref:helix-turn-helix domain-containing protein n=1 Tax=Microbulbifer agarilyticus TaxID=260552 RepID=UPI0021BC100C|nr:helix-turn-helix transcriptional regulator [Microbulbifer agarilyticus]